MKRLFYILISLVCAFALYQWSSSLIDKTYIHALEKGWLQPSPFIQQSVLDNQLVYKGKTVSVLYNYKPLLPGHILIIPSRPVQRLEDVTSEEWLEMKQVINLMHGAFKRAYNADDYILVLQNGLAAGQTVPHVHFHMLPREHQSIVYTKWIVWKSFLTGSFGLRKPLSPAELEESVDALKQHIGEVDVPK